MPTLLVSGPKDVPERDRALLVSARKDRRPTSPPHKARLPSANALLPNRDLPYILVVQFVAESGLVTDHDGAARRSLDRRLNDVPLPITLAGRYVPGQHEIRQGCERNIVRPADPRFKHSAAPYGDSRRLRHIVHAPRLRESTDPSELDIDDAAGAQFDRLLGVVRRADAFVKADGRFQLGL